VIATSGTGLGQVQNPNALAVDTTGNLYVADQSSYGELPRIEARDVQGNWSVIATGGTGLAQVSAYPALAVDTAGNLFVAEPGNSRIEKRNVQGNWSIIATSGAAPGEVQNPNALAVDTVGNLYVAEYNNHRIQKRDVQGTWSVIASSGAAPGQVDAPSVLAADSAGNLYVAEYNYGTGYTRIQKRDAQGNWSLIATGGMALGQVTAPSSLAVDAAGNLYVADQGKGVQKRDTQGNWSVLTTRYGDAIGQVDASSALTTDSAGNLYVAEGSYYGNNRIQKRDAQGNWSVIGSRGDGLGQVQHPWALAVDATGNLYVLDVTGTPDYRLGIQRRDAQGKWSVIATEGYGLGQVYYGDGGALAVDAAGNLYVADRGHDGQGHYGFRVQKRDVQGHWSILAAYGIDVWLIYPTALAVDTAGNLYEAQIYNGEAEHGFNAIQKRDAPGNWSVIVGGGYDLGQVAYTTALAVDVADNLYVAEGASNPRIQKRDAQGNWSVLATSALGQDYYPQALAADAAGNLYVADGYSNRVLEYVRHTAANSTILPEVRGVGKSGCRSAKCGLTLRGAPKWRSRDRRGDGHGSRLE
jgi:tripartite motif-containing protein 71